MAGGCEETGYRVFEIAEGLAEMLIFVEAERLSMTALELIGNMFDGTGVGDLAAGPFAPLLLELLNAASWIMEAARKPS